MTKWTAGAAEIESMLAKRYLERVTGARADGGPWLAKATLRLETAAGTVSRDPESAFVLAYDAARFVGEALLAQQGLRATQAGGHLVVADALRAQFGGPFTALGTLRRRRNEVEYPSLPGETVEEPEATAAIATARGQLEAADKLLDHLGMF